MNVVALCSQPESRGKGRLLLHRVTGNEEQFTRLYIALKCRYKFPTENYGLILFFFHSLASVFPFIPFSPCFSFFVIWPSPSSPSLLFVICWSYAYFTAYFTNAYFNSNPVVRRRMLCRSPELNPSQNCNFSPFILPDSRVFLFVIVTHHPRYRTGSLHFIRGETTCRNMANCIKTAVLSPALHIWLASFYYCFTNNE